MAATVAATAILKNPFFSLSLSLFLSSYWHDPTSALSGYLYVYISSIRQYLMHTSRFSILNQ